MRPKPSLRPIEIIVALVCFAVAVAILWPVLRDFPEWARRQAREEAAQKAR